MVGSSWRHQMLPAATSMGAAVMDRNSWSPVAPLLGAWQGIQCSTHPEDMNNTGPVHGTYCKSLQKKLQRKRNEHGQTIRNTYLTYLTWSCLKTNAITGSRDRVFRRCPAPPHGSWQPVLRVGSTLEQMQSSCPP